MAKIVACKIGPYPKGMFDMQMPEVNVTFDDGTSKMLFTFYPDEINFGEWQFIGLTEQEARDLRHRTDVAYLRS